MYEFHQDKNRYFNINVDTTAQHIIPFITSVFPIRKGMRVLDIGCGEGAVLQPFLDAGCTGVGVELDSTRLVHARHFLSKYMEEEKVSFVSQNIHSPDIDSSWDYERFDIIILKDVIEHIFDKEQLMKRMKDFLHKDGVIFFGFPPWQMPMGGHQQILKNKYLSKIPYYHLLPMPVYKKIIEAAKENVQEMVEIKQTGISIEAFEKIVKHAGYTIEAKKHYLFNPIYEHKFGIKPKLQIPIIRSVPYLRNFLTTCAYYLIKQL